MTDLEYDGIAAETLRLVAEVAIPSLHGKEDALEVLKRIAGLEREVSLMLIVRGLEAAKGIVAGTSEVCAYFMLLGAILATEHQRRQRVVSIDRAKQALPDYVTEEATSAPPTASEGER